MIPQPKDMDERFDAEFGWLFKELDEERVTNDADKIATDIKSFLRKELADQKARAIEIARDNPCKMSGRIPHNHTATCNRAIATALEVKL